MARFRLFAAILVAAASSAPALAGEPRVADIRVGRHGDFERIVVEFDAPEPVDVRWSEGENGADVFAIEARPLLSRQVLSSGRPLVGDMLLLAAESGSELHLVPGSRRTRAFLLEEPPRLVIDVAPAGDEPFDPPADVRPILRGAAAESEPEQAESPASAAAAQPPAAPAASAPVEPSEAATPEPTQAAPLAELTPPAPAPAERASAPAAQSRAEARGESQPALSQKNWLLSRALLVPLLAGAGVLLLAAGGLALASAQRSRGRRGRQLPLPLPDAVDLGGLTPLSADRLDLLEKRLDDEVRARTQLEEQLAQTRAELASLRDLLARLRSQAAARAAAPSAPQ